MKIGDFFSLNLNSKLFWFVTVLVMITAIVHTYVHYQETQSIIEKRMHDRAVSLNDYFVAMRHVYQQQFVKSKLDLNDSTIGFLPAHAACAINDEFTKKSAQKISIKNVSDDFRNPINKSDAVETEAINFFRAHPDKKELEKTITIDGTEFYFFAAPLTVSQDCLACHGEKEKTLPYIKNRYDKAFGYKVGDIRGITSIKIEKSTFANPIMDIYVNATLLWFISILALLTLAYAAITRLTKRDMELKVELENKVSARTIELATAYEKERHLLSILRTVADVNQLLITSENVNELIDQAVHTLHENPVFASVKIMLMNSGTLEVKASLGVSADKVPTEIDIDVFRLNEAIYLQNLDGDNISDSCRERAKKYALKAIYSVPLRSSIYESRPVGVMTVCTKEIGGFGDKERAMIDELAGDIGFAVNSFVQKNTIKGLLDEQLKSYHEFIEALVDMIEQRDTYTAGHTQRVAKYSVMIAEEMGVGESDVRKLAEAARLHDIGKVVTPDSILLKPGVLTGLEYELIKEHVNAGYQVLSNIQSYKELADIIIYHHERYNGSGYPYGKQGDEIPLLGHILSVADSFDAMTTNRIYKPRKSVAESLLELESMSGTLYHPDVVKAASRVLRDVKIDDAMEQAIGTSPIDQERLSYFFRDRLTRLYNEDYLSIVLNGRSSHEKPKTLTVISLADFTRYNKEHMWEGGNILLIRFAEFLMQNIQGRMLFRIKGDHFCIADYDGDITKLLKASPLEEYKIAYRTITLEAPFGNILMH